VRSASGRGFDSRRLHQSKKGGNMLSQDLPEQYKKLKERYGELFEVLERLGTTVRDIGPLDEKTIQLIQLAASAAIRSEGAVHSHARRALKAGATEMELYHAILCLTSTIGFPTVSAALSWIEDVLREGSKHE